MGVLLIDASTAFNSPSVSMLLHVRKLWPRCACFVFNTYCGWSVLVMRGMSDFILSKEGVMQGDPCLYMSMRLVFYHSVLDSIVLC